MAVIFAGRLVILAGLAGGDAFELFERRVPLLTDAPQSVFQRVELFFRLPQEGAAVQAAVVLVPATEARQRAGLDFQFLQSRNHPWSSRKRCLSREG